MIERPRWSGEYFLRPPQNLKARSEANLGAGFRFRSGGDLLSHAASRAVPSALRGLTSVFGMGTGVTLSTKPPENLKERSLKGFENRIVKFEGSKPRKHLLLVSKFYGQALGLISTGQLNVLPRFHTQPINLVVYKVSHWQVSSWVWLHA